ncbi:SAM-dependent methyltransferase [Kitasatospora sp. NPDC089797]|uniref:SAM-dependent methyltransferase n=1 Tax=Kitasatospora sp. NPDC089797 TaxID=3155298 RepID=UPI0034196593
MTTTAVSTAARPHDPGPGPRSGLQRHDAQRARTTALLARVSYAGIRDHLGGGHDANSASRTAALRLLDLLPNAHRLAQDALDFAAHAATVLVHDLGIRQIVHLDHGVPGHGPRRNTHEIAREAAPHCRTVYADADPVVHARARCVLAGSGREAVAEVGLAAGADRVLEHPAVTALLDPDQPVAVLCTTLETVPDPVANRLMADLARLLPSGGYLAVCQPTLEDARQARQVDETMADLLDGQWGRLRTPAQFAALLRDAPLEELGVVTAPGYLRSAYRPAAGRRGAVLGAIARIAPAAAPSPAHRDAPAALPHASLPCPGAS